jgi:hypothetical protein
MRPAAFGSLTRVASVLGWRHRTIREVDVEIIPPERAEPWPDDMVDAVRRYLPETDETHIAEPVPAEPQRQNHVPPAPVLADEPVGADEPEQIEEVEQADLEETVETDSLHEEPGEVEEVNDAEPQLAALQLHEVVDEPALADEPEEIEEVAEAEPRLAEAQLHEVVDEPALADEPEEIEEVAEAESRLAEAQLHEVVDEPEEIEEVAEPEPVHDESEHVEPSVAADGEAELREATCEITLWRGWRQASFYARIVADGREIAVAQSATFRPTGKNELEQTYAAMAAHRELCETLVGRGWKRTGRGDEWYSDSFSAHVRIEEDPDADESVSS